MKFKRGRPKLPKGDARSVMLHFRLTKAEMEALERKAKVAGATVSNWARTAIIERP